MQSPDPVSMLDQPVGTLGELVEERRTSRNGITLVNRYLEETPLPYAVLSRGARRAANRLSVAGVRPGDRVALVSSTSVGFLVSLFGAWRAGAVPVVLPLPHRLHDLAKAPEELTSRIRFADCACVVVADELSEFVPAVALDVPSLTCADLLSERTELRTPAPSEPDDVAYLQFTSGTTGSSRAVALTHRQILSNVAGTLRHLVPNVDGDLVHVSWLPLFHDMGLMTTIGAVWLDSRLVLQPPEEFMRRPDSWVDALSKYRAVSTWAPNFAYAVAARSITTRPRDLDLSQLQIAGDGAEPIRLETLEQFAAAGVRYGLRPEAVVPMYGLAEATVAVSIGEIRKPLMHDTVSRSGLEIDREARPVRADSPDARRLAVCGHPIPGVEVAIIDADGERVGERRVGEICVSGPSVMRGYWRDEAGTSAVLRDGWLHTGDLGYLAPEGLVVCGRLKDMIIAAGRNIYPEDYEQVAATVDGVRRTAAAFVLPGTERMVVAVEPGMSQVGPEELAEQILERLRERVGYLPEQVLVVKRGSIPLTSSGKVRRAACREQFLAGELPVEARIVREEATDD